MSPNATPERSGAVTEVNLLVSVLVEPVASEGTLTPRLVRRAALQAIRNALWDREDSGFDHDRSDRLTVQMVGISLVKPRKGPVSRSYKVMAAEKSVRR